MEAPSKHLTLKQRTGYDDVNNETKRNPAGKFYDFILNTYNFIFTFHFTNILNNMP